MDANAMSTVRRKIIWLAISPNLVIRLYPSITDIANWGKPSQIALLFIERPSKFSETEFHLRVDSNKMWQIFSHRKVV